MPKLSSAQLTDLLDLLLELPSTKTADQRAALLFSLPAQIVNTLDLSGDRLASLATLVETLEYWGQLADGRWATEVMLRNALRTARNTAFEQKLEAIRRSFDLPSAQAQLPELPEQIASDVSYLMPVAFLADGDRVARAVARLAVPQYMKGQPVLNGRVPSLVVGTGWMIAPGLLVTNYHVVEARFAGDPPPTSADIALQAEHTVAWFDYVDVDKPYVEYKAVKAEALNPALDYAILRLAAAATRAAAPDLDQWDYLTLASELDELTRGMPLNIVQHPAGDVKQIAIRRNDFVGAADGDEFYYLTDTLPGSSGSPVFDDDWRVVGLHRASRTLPEKVYLKGETIKYNNVGVRIHAVVRDLPQSLRQEIEAARRPVSRS
jgi:V8-like Glu-specific endopeptidase